MRFGLVEQAQLEGVRFDDLINRLENDWTTLDQGLRQWEEQEGFHHPAEQTLGRGTVGATSERCPDYPPCLAART
ncbi:hypothetical protein QZH47_06875 [Pseudomonas corrugata]